MHRTARFIHDYGTARKKELAHSVCRQRVSGMEPRRYRASLPLVNVLNAAVAGSSISDEAPSMDAPVLHPLSGRLAPLKSECERVGAVVAKHGERGYRRLPLGILDVDGNLIDLCRSNDHWRARPVERTLECLCRLVEGQQG